jgi:hypothetical protein
MIRLALAGGLVGGIYGVINDQITFTLSPEYFTNLKFHQFAWANIGLPPRFFVAEIGFLAAGAVGAFAGWVIGRIATPVWPPALVIRSATACFAIMLAFGIAAGIAGWVLGGAHDADYSNWESILTGHHVTDAPAFVRVAYIHNASYLGALAGFAVSVCGLLWKRRGNYPEK